MSQTVQPPPEYSQFDGVDLSVPYQQLKPTAAERMQNARFLPSGSACARPGQKVVAVNRGGSGLLEYIRPNLLNVACSDLFTVGQHLYKLHKGRFTVNYSGAAVSVITQMLFDDSTLTWKYKISEDGTEVISVDLGTGIDDAVPVYLSTLKTQIELRAGYTVVIDISELDPGQPFETGSSIATTDTPACYLPQLVSEALVSGTLTTEFSFFTQQREPYGWDPFANHWTARSSTPNATSVNVNDVLVIATQKDFPVKYDDNCVYRYGMARGSLATITPTGAGTFGGDFVYQMRYAHYDHKGNYVSGTLSDFVTVSSTGKTSYNVTLPTLQQSSGYATDYAVVNGNQSGVTNIVVTAGHSLKLQDWITLIDRSVSARTVTRRQIIDIPDGTHITISGAAVNVSTLDVISHGLVIELYRTRNKTGFFYDLAILPNDPRTTSITFVDTIVDASLGDLLIEPSRNPDPPPKGGIIVLHQGLPVISGSLEDPNRICWADPDISGRPSEGFPEDINSVTAYSQKGGSITALWPSAAGLEVFYRTSQYRIVGSLADYSLQLTKISLATGCIGQQVICETSAGPLAWLSEKGPRQMSEGGIPSSMGRSLDKIFLNKRTGESKFDLSRAVVVDWAFENMLLLFLPCITEEGGEAYANSYSEVWVLDYQIEGRARWLGPWTGIDLSGGAIGIEQDLHYIERRYSTPLVAGKYELHQFHTRKDDFDQVDHTGAIPLDWAPGWEDLGSRTTAKIANWLRLYSSDPQRVSGYEVDVTIETNFRPNVSFMEFILAIGSGGGDSGWQFEPWGFFPWGLPSADYVEATLKKEGTFAIRPVFRHNRVYENPIISLYAMGYSLPYVAGGVKR